MVYLEKAVISGPSGDNEGGGLRRMLPHGREGIRLLAHRFSLLNFFLVFELYRPFEGLVKLLVLTLFNDHPLDGRVNLLEFVLSLGLLRVNLLLQNRVGKISSNEVGVPLLVP